MKLLIFSVILTFSVTGSALAAEREIEIGIAKDLISRPAYNKEQEIDGTDCDLFRDYASSNNLVERQLPDGVQNILLNCRYRVTKSLTDDDALLLFGIKSRACFHNINTHDSNESLLTNSERFAICFYSNLGSREINNSLRTSDGRKETLPNITAALDSALAKLPNYTSTTVTRLMNLSEKQIKEYSIVRSFTWHTFTSSSFDRNTFKGNVRFVITSKTGKDVHLLSGLPEENEVIFPRDTKFHVTGAKVFSDGNYEIEIVED